MAAADLLIFNAKALTMDEAAPRAEAVAIAGNRIIAVGDLGDVEAHAGAETRRIDAKGGTLLPGFVESHMHLFSGAYGRKLMQLAEVQGEAALAAEIRAFSAANPEEGLLIGQGTPYDILGDDHLITRHDLDRMEPDRPLILMGYDFHTSWANTAALRAAGLLEGRDVGAGNEVVMGADGLATGELREKNAFLPVLDLRTSGGREMLGMTGIEPETPPSPEERAADIEVMKEGMRYCAAQGITAIHNMDGNRYMLELLHEIEQAGEMACRVEVPFHLTLEMPYSELDRAMAMHADFNSDMLKSGRVKLFCDGVMESGTALFVEDYANQPGYKGESIFDAEAFRKAAIEVDRRGLQISTHAIGDGAVRITLDGYEAAQKANGRRDSRHRIEHIELIHEDDVPRLAELGVIASMQPLHAPQALGEPLEIGLSAIGDARWHLAFAWRSLVDTGAEYCFSSDWPIVTVEPLVGIKAALSREPWAEGLPDQRLSLQQTLEAYTWRGAHAAFLEDRTGRIRPGMLADLVLLGGDIEATAPADMPRLGPVLTICDGKITHQS
ncbi:MAG: amidohydrolase [Maritimibacter sp.]